MKMKSIVPLVCAVVFALSVNATAAGLSVCTHVGNASVWDADSTVTAAKQMGSEYIRDELRWRNVEYTKGNFSLPTNAVWSSWVNKAVEQGVKPLCILGFGNGVYQENGDEYTSIHLPTYGTKTGDAAQKEQEYWEAWESYVTLVATTYKGKIKAYEVWNEPNHPYFNNDINAENYAKLYIATRALIKSIDPDAVVLCGSITGTGQTERTFINSILDYIKNNGGLSQIDAFAIHLYTHGSIPEETYLTSLNTLYYLTFAAKGYTGDIWMTENGKYTGTYTNSVTEAEQAAMAVRQTVIWDSFLKSKNIGGVNIWYDLKNDGTDLSNSENNYGLMYNDFTPKPAYTAASLFNSLTNGMSFKSLSTSSDKYVAEYADNKGGHTFVAWKTGSGTGTVTINIPERETKVYSLGGAVTQTISETGSRTFTVSSSPVMINSEPSVPEFGNSTVVSYNVQTKKINVSGTIENFQNEQEVSFLVVPHGTVLSNGLNPQLVGYVGSINTNSSSFSHSFGLPEWFCGEADVYLGGYGMKNSVAASTTIPDNQYLYVASIDVNKSSLVANAVLRNFTSSTKDTVVIVAAYKDNMMIGFKAESFLVPAKTYIPVNVSTVGYELSEAPDEVRVFALDNLYYLVPLIKCVVK